MANAKKALDRIWAFHDGPMVGYFVGQSPGEGSYVGEYIRADLANTPSPESIVRAALEIILADAQILRWIAEGYDKEDAAMIGEPDPWLLDDAGDIGDAETWQAERIGCARFGLFRALHHATIAEQNGETNEHH
jgi:hypothetical protein